MNSILQTFSIKTLFLFILVLVVSRVESQNLPNRRYTTADGLVADRITCAVQDDKGFMWVGTYFGLSRYDGNRFTTIPLPPIQQNKYVGALTAADGKVYAGFWFNGGLLEYDNGIIKTFHLNPGNKEIVNDVIALCPHNKKGIVVAFGGNRIYQFADGRFKHMFSLDSNLKSSMILSMTMDKNGNTWVGTINGLVVHTAKNKKILLSKNNTTSLHENENGMTVVSGTGNKYQVETFTSSGDSFSSSNIIWKSNEIMPVAQKSFDKNNIWLLDSANRFHFLNSTGKVSVSSTSGVNREDIHYLYADRENNLWIATHTGLVKLSNLPALSYAFDEKGTGTGYITGNDSILFITNSYHLYTLSENKLKKVVGMPFQDKHEMIGRLLWDGSYVWVSSWNYGIWKLKISDNKVISKTFIEGHNDKKIKVHAMIRGTTGSLWVAGENGIFYLRNGKVINHFLPPSEKNKPSLIIALALDTAKNILWAGDNEFGIYKYKYRINADTISYEFKGRIKAESGLTDGHIRSLYYDSKENLWAGTRFGGIFRIQDKAGKFVVENLTNKANLVCTRVTHITEDNNQSVWFASCNGVYSYQHSTDQWQSYTTAGGLMDSEVFTNFISSSKQTCYAVSPSGVTALQFRSTNKTPVPLVNITRITVLGKNDSTAIFNQSASSYSAGQSSIGFQFAGSSYTDEKKVWYKYMLEGYDNSWSHPTQTNNVNYVSLPPGDYTFKVLASTGNNEWSTEPANFSFTIVRPFYKSPLFYLLLISLAFAGFYFIRTYQLKQRLQLEKLRSRISSDLHDDIGSTLSSISIISEGAIEEKDPVASRQMIREINENTMFLMDKMDDIIWCVNPQNDSFQHLMLRIKKFAASLFEAKGIDYDIDIDENIGEPSLPMAYRQHIYLILKESINNLVKYSCATHAGICIQAKGSYLTITIKDNGKGFDVDAARNGNGLRNMKNRAGQMKADLEMESNAHGTTISLKTKIK